MKSHGKTKISILTVFICAMVILALSLVIGATDTPDSFQYMTLGRYFYTGKISGILPYNTDKPHTLFGPIYSLLVGALHTLPMPWESFLLPAIQLSLFSISAWFVYKILRQQVSDPWPLVGSLVFILLPFNLIYATFIMSETLTQFFVALFLYILSLQSKLSPKRTWALLIFIASVATLTRYGFVILFLLSIVVWLCLQFKFLFIHRLLGSLPPKTRKTHTSTLIDGLPAIAGILLVFLWIQFTYRTNGRWALSLYTGRHLYNNVVFEGHILPPAGHQALKPFTSRFGSTQELYQPWWMLQPWFATTPEVEADRAFFDISFAAIVHHPLAYAGNIIKHMVLLPATALYTRDSLVTDLRACTYASCHACVPAPYNNFECWNKSICEPAVRLCSVRTVWAGFIEFSKSLYPVVAIMIFVIVIVGILKALIWAPAFARWVAIIFLLVHGFQSAVEMIEARFVVPLYPAYAILFVYGLSFLLRLVFKYNGRHNGKT